MLHHGRNILIPITLFICSTQVKLAKMKIIEKTFPKTKTTNYTQGIDV